MSNPDLTLRAAGWLDALLQDPLAADLWEFPAVAEIERLASQSVIAVEPVDKLHVRPCAQPAAMHHWSCLTSLRESEGGAITSAKARYHARWLAWLLTREPQHMPRISVVIPAYNENAEILVSTLGSALRQTHSANEIILVDDGADPPLCEIIPPEVLLQLRYHRQANQGVAQARNRGIELARGELIHFLDADDLLRPECLEQKLRVYCHVADTEACISLYDCIGDNGVKSINNHVCPEVGDFYCPSLGLLRTVMQRFPFQISTLMVPRWTMLDVGPFEADLRQSQDNRQWFKLGLRNTKVAGIGAPLAQRRFRTGSLTSNGRESAWYSLFSYFRNLRDLIRSQHHWRELVPYLRRCLHKPRLELTDASVHPGAETVCQEVIEAFRHLSVQQFVLRLSCRPLLPALRQVTLDSRLRFVPQLAAPFCDELLSVFDDLEGQAAGMTELDLEYWIGGVPGQLVYAENAAVLLTLRDWIRSPDCGLSSTQVAHWQSRLEELMRLPQCSESATDAAKSVSPTPSRKAA